MVSSYLTLLRKINFTELTVGHSKLALNHVISRVQLLPLTTTPDEFFETGGCDERDDVVQSELDTVDDEFAHAHFLE
jgi:hypothetical protein